MNYADFAAEGCADTPFHHPSTGSAILPRAWLTPDEVEEGLVEAWLLWRRSPGGGRWPFAADGPWHLVSREAGKGDWDARGVDGEAPPPRETGLSTKEVARRDALSAWLQFAPDRDRRLVCMVIEQLGRGRQRPDFMALRPMFPNAQGKALGADGLRKRYGRALTAIARGVGRGVV